MLAAACASPEAPRVRVEIPPAECPETRFLPRETEVVDTRTGLVWRRCPLGQQYYSGLGTCAGEAAAFTTIEAARAATAKAQPAMSGAAWRLPTSEELAGIAAPACRPMFGKQLPSFAGQQAWTRAQAADGQARLHDLGRNTLATVDAKKARAFVFAVTR